MPLGKRTAPFFEMLKEQKIVLGNIDNQHRKGDLVLLTDGYTVIGLAEVLENSKVVTANKNLQKPLEDNKIGYDDYAYYSPAKIIELSDNKFTYNVQKGIVGVNKSDIISKAIALWEGHTKKML